MEKRKYLLEKELPEWDGEYSEEIISLHMDLNDTLSHLNLIKIEIEKIQNNCEHKINVFEYTKDKVNVFVCTNCAKETKIEYLD